jgi:hypothetical protein
MNRIVEIEIPLIEKDVFIPLMKRSFFKERDENPLCVLCAFVVNPFIITLPEIDATPRRRLRC